MEMIIEKDLELRKGKKNTGMSKNKLSIIDYLTSHESIKSYLMVEAKIILASGVMLKVKIYLKTRKGKET